MLVWSAQGGKVRSSINEVLLDDEKNECRCIKNETVN